MSVVPGAVDTDNRPPTAIPLRHFLLGLAFLVAGVVVAGLDALGVGCGLTRLASLHLLLAGWVGLTIMGAMTLFVPVWSGVPLHSRRLATRQLQLVGLGLAGLVAALLLGRLDHLPVFGFLLLAGFWTFAYNVGRTLLQVGDRDVTETHFLLALGFFVLLSALGLVLAVDFGYPLLAPIGVDRGDVVGAHATLAVLGGVLTTVFGALYQLATMFTGSQLDALDRRLQRVETVVYPLGVVALATGRLFRVESLTLAGGVLVVAGVVAVAVVLARRLLGATVEPSPLMTRYGVASALMLAWAAATLPAWLADPLDRDALLGSPGVGRPLVLGFVGFVVLGTLYHVVPFLAWLDRYADRVGLERVPMVDDLYSTRLARADYAATTLGLAGVVGWEAGLIPGPVAAVAGALLGLGMLGFVANMLLVVHRHGPPTLGSLVVGVDGAGDGEESGSDRRVDDRESSP